MVVGLDGNCLVIAGVLDGRRDVAEEGKMTLKINMVESIYQVSICDEDMPTSSRRTVVEYIVVDFYPISICFLQIRMKKRDGGRIYLRLN